MFVCTWAGLGPGLHQDSHHELDSRLTTATQRRHHGSTQTLPNLLFLSEQRQILQTTTRHSHGFTGFRCCGRNRHAEHRTTSKDEIDFLHEHLNKQTTYIQFTREIEENGKIPFLDCLVSRDNNKLRTTVYRKPTHTDRLLDQCSYHPTCHKATAVRTLTIRAHVVGDSHNSLPSETKHLHDVFHKNNYNQDFISRNYYRANRPNSTNTRPTTVTMATVPYIKGTSETIARILQPHGIRVAHKPITTLRHLLTNVKDKVEPKDRQGAVYKIKCCNCPATYVGETGRNLNTPLTEHRRATKNGDNKTTESTGTLLNVFHSVQTTTNDLL